MKNYVATLKNGSELRFVALQNNWQAFFCANIVAPGDVLKVQPKEDKEMPEFLRRQA